MSSRIRYEIISATSAELLGDMDNNRLSIPAHQRQPLLWTLKAQQGFVKSVQEGIPTTGILQREWDGSLWLEDGLQRLSTLRRYLADGFPDDEDRLYSTLPDTLKNHMTNYKFAVTRYRNATPQQAIRVFDNAQNGMPLSIGQRMHSLKEYPSPLVDYAYRNLLTAGAPLHDRAIAVWGNRSAMDKKCNTLVNAVTLVSGIVFNIMTKKWLEIQSEGILYNDIGDTAAITDKLNWLLSIYEQVNTQSGPASKAILNKQWNVGNINAYIIWSLNTYPTERQRLFDGWVNWLVRWRRNSILMDTELKADVSSARSWNETRWRRGYDRVFNPAAAAAAAVVYAEVSDDDDYEDEE